MNVLLVIHTPRNPYTAVYNHYCQLAAFLEKQGHGATILAPEDFSSLSHWHARWFPILYPFWVAKWLISEGRSYDLAAFHSYSGWVFNLLRRCVPGFRRVRTITAFHGLEPLCYDALREETAKVGHGLRLRSRLAHGILVPWLIRASCRRSDRILCLNREEAAYLERNRWGHESQIAQVPHGVPQGFFISRQYAHRPRRLLFVGQWLERKGIRYLVEAFSILARGAPDLELWCVGTLVDEQRVQADFPEEIRSQVVVRSTVGREELIEVYTNADVFLFPSLFEGFSVALLEAMAAGLPVVATPVGAAPELLKSEANALIIPKGDAETLATSARRLLEDAGLRERLSHEAQATAAEYELERVHRQFVSLFREVAGSRS